MRYTGHADRFDGCIRSAVAVARTRVAGLRSVGVDRRLAQAVNVGPLFDFLAEVDVVQHFVIGAMPQLHAWPRAVVAGILVA